MSTPKQIRRGDIVDWPEHERDGYVFTSVNTVVNSFHLRALDEMSHLAQALGKTQDAAKFSEQERTAQATFREKLFDPARGLYRDGVGTDHGSLHANLFPLAFGLVPADKRPLAPGDCRRRWSGAGRAAARHRRYTSDRTGSDCVARVRTPLSELHSCRMQDRCR
jgi:hypothetical protein